MEEKNKDIILNAKQVSEYLQIPLRTVHHLSKQGRIKAVKIGKHWKYLQSDIGKHLLFGTDYSKEPSRRPNNFTDQRVYPRINCCLSCYIRVIIPHKKEVSTTARILNISEDGIFIKDFYNGAAFLKIKADDPMEVTFELDRAIKINVDSRVLRTQDKGIAVKFKKINSEAKELIREYVG